MNQYIPLRPHSRGCPALDVQSLCTDQYIRPIDSPGCVRMQDDSNPSEDVPHADADERLRGGVVSFVDRNQVRWRVTERDARYDPGSRGHWCLIFACDDAVRRVWVYPARWRSLSPSELEVLSWSPSGTPGSGGGVS